MRIYHQILHSHPILTQAVTTGALFAAGDIIAQNIVERKDTHDWKRTGRLTFFGTVIAGK